MKLFSTFLLNVMLISLAATLVQGANRAVVNKISVIPADQEAIVLSVLPVKNRDPFDSKLIDISKKLLLATDRFDSVEVGWDGEKGELLVEVSPKLYFERIQWSGDSVSDRQNV